MVCVAGEHTEQALRVLQAAGEQAWLLGEIANAENPDERVILSDT